jgi:NACHT N-terminal Helical domain 1
VQGLVERFNYCGRRISYGHRHSSFEGVRTQGTTASGSSFEDIEEQVADSILQSMGHEYRDVPENERQAAILAAAGSFDKANLAAPDLFATDLDPLFLARHVKRQSPRATRDLSSGGVELYDQIVAACSEYIVGASTALPGFTVGTFSELLHRQSETLERLAGLAVSLEQSTKRTNAEHFASAYSQLVVSQLDRVQLFGFTISDALRRYPLSASYITLTVAAKSDSTVDSWRRLYDQHRPGALRAHRDHQR